MSAEPFFTSSNTAAAYQLRYHFVWYTRGRKPLFASPAMRESLSRCLRDVAERNEYHILESDIVSNAVCALLSLKPCSSPSSVTRIIKGNLATSLRNEFQLREVWSRNLFARSIGAVTNDVVQDYVAKQFEHHCAEPTSSSDSLARYHGSGDPGALRKTDHAAFEYNLHVVLVVRGRVSFLDAHVAKMLIDYWLRVCEKKQWIPWEIEIVGDHTHLFLGVRPSDSPEDVALSLMNNAAHYLHLHFGEVLRDEMLRGVWTPGFYVGTVGSATTAQIKAYLRGAEAEGDIPPG